MFQQRIQRKRERVPAYEIRRKFQAHAAENQGNVVIGLERADGQEAGGNLIVLSY